MGSLPADTIKSKCILAHFERPILEMLKSTSWGQLQRMEQETFVRNVSSMSVVSQDNPTVHINTSNPMFSKFWSISQKYGLIKMALWLFSADLARPESLILHWEILSASSSFLKAVYIALQDVQEKDPPLPSLPHLEGFAWGGRSKTSPLLLFRDRWIPPTDRVPSPRSPSAMSSSEDWSMVLACSRSPCIISSFTWTQCHEEQFQCFSKIPFFPLLI